MEYKLISSDAHIDLEFLPADLFVANAPAAWRDKVPRRYETDDGYVWRAGDIVLSLMPRNQRMSTPETIDRTERMEATGFFDDAEAGNPRPSSVELRLKDMDLDGIEAEIIYGLTFAGIRLLGVKSSFLGADTGPQVELVHIMYRIYNDWVADFCKKAPDRLGALACISNQDPQAAADETRRAAELGLKGVEFDVAGSSMPIYYRDWDVVWSTAAECNMPLSFHIAGGVGVRAPRPEDNDKYYWKPYRSMTMVLGQLMGPHVLASVMLSGACERFPDFKFVLGEAGVTWLPYILDRLDHECTDYPGLKFKPSEYWRRQGYTTYQSEGLVGDLIGLIGEDNVMWGSDYPHPDGVWPDSQEITERDLSNLKDEKIKRKILRDNTAKLYNFG